MFWNTVRVADRHLGVGEGSAQGSTGLRNFETGEKNVWTFPGQTHSTIINSSFFSLSNVLQLDDRLYIILPLTKDILRHRVESWVHLQRRSEWGHHQGHHKENFEEKWWFIKTSVPCSQTIGKEGYMTITCDTLTMAIIDNCTTIKKIHIN